MKYRRTLQHGWPLKTLGCETSQTQKATDCVIPCGFVIYNKKQKFGVPPIPGTELSKNLGIS